MIKNRLICLIVIITLCLSSLYIPVLAEEQNLVINSGFEKDLSNWEPVSGAVLSIQKGGANNSANCLKVQTVGNFSAPATRLQFKSGESYLISFYIKTEKVSNSLTLLQKFNNGTWVYPLMGKPITQTWKKVSAIYTFDGKNTKGQDVDGAGLLNFRVGDGVQKVIFYIDDVKIVPIDKTANLNSDVVIDNSPLPISPQVDYVDQETQGAKDIKRLTTFGIIDETEVIQDDIPSITRSDYMQIIARLLGIADVSDSQKFTTLYKDVNKNHPAIATIDALTKLGYVKGDENNYFYPDRAITYNEAISILVMAMGYTNEAIQKGGYPTGFMSVAIEKKIIKGLQFKGDATIPLMDVYRMISSCLDIDVCRQTGFGDVPEYSIINGDTPLKVFHNIQKKSGMVTGNRYTNITSSTNDIGKDEIQIDGIKYKTLNEDYSHLLGMQVEGYFKNDIQEDTNTLLYVMPKANKNTSTKIKSDDIISISDNTLYYNELNNEKKVNIKISDNVDVIYNGRMLAGYGSLTKIIPTEGYITALDNNQDSVAEILFVTDYKNILAGDIDKSNNKMFDKLTKRYYSLDNSIDDVEIYFDTGKRAGVNDIKPYDVVAVLESKNTSGKLLKRAYITTNIVTGKVEEVSNDLQECTINSMKYKIAPSYSANNTPITLQLSGNFYLNLNGKIVAYKSVNNTDFAYGIVRKIEKSVSVAGYIEAKIFNQDNYFEIYKLADKVNINGRMYSVLKTTDSTAILSLITAGKLIRFKLNMDGKISNINIASPNAVAGDLRMVFSGTSFKHRYATFAMTNTDTTQSGDLDAAFVIDGNTVSFSVPTDLTDEKSYLRVSGGSFGSGTTYTKNFEAYNLGDNDVNLMSVLVIRDLFLNGKATDFSDGNLPLIVVTKIATSLETGTEAQKIYGIEGNKNPFEACTDPENFASTKGVQVGDIIRVILNADGNIIDIETVMNVDGLANDAAWLVRDVTPLRFKTFDPDYNFGYGKAVAFENGIIKVAMEGKFQGTAVSPAPAPAPVPYIKNLVIKAGNSNYILYNSGNKTATVVDKTELVVGDKFVFKTILSDTKEIVIIR